MEAGTLQHKVIFYGRRSFDASLLSAPLIETIDHFWRMIWEYGVETIVMLTRCVELSRVSYPTCLVVCVNHETSTTTQDKCAQYWPESLNENITPGDRISVTLLASTPYAEYHIRKFLVKHVSD